MSRKGINKNIFEKLNGEDSGIDSGTDLPNSSESDSTKEKVNDLKRNVSNLILEIDKRVGEENGKKLENKFESYAKKYDKEKELTVNECIDKMKKEDLINMVKSMKREFPEDFKNIDDSIRNYESREEKVKKLKKLNKIEKLNKNSKRSKESREEKIKKLKNLEELERVKRKNINKKKKQRRRRNTERGDISIKKDVDRSDIPNIDQGKYKKKKKDPSDRLKKGVNPTNVGKTISDDDIDKLMNILDEIKNDSNESYNSEGISSDNFSDLPRDKNFWEIVINGKSLGSIISGFDGKVYPKLSDKAKKLIKSFLKDQGISVEVKDLGTIAYDTLGFQVADKDTAKAIVKKLKPILIQYSDDSEDDVVMAVENKFLEDGTHESIGNFID